MAMFRRHKPSDPSLQSEDQQRPQSGDDEVHAIQLGLVRLYQPDDVLRVRLPQGTGELAAYVQTLVWTCNEFLGRLGQDFGSMGILIAVGVKPPKSVRLWCEQVGGDLPDEVWSLLVDLLNGAGAGVRPEVTGPIALAIEGVIGTGPACGFPEVPRAWVDAIQGAEEPVSVPDGIFAQLFAE